MIIEPVNPPLDLVPAVPVSISLEVAAFIRGGPGPAGPPVVFEYADFAALPAEGEASVLYMTVTPYSAAGVTSSLFRWDGAAYEAVTSTPDSADAVAEGSTHLYFLGSRVLATVLAGLSTASSAVISSADSVLSGFGKLQAQLTALANAVSNVDNTADIDKPVSTPQQAALDLKVNVGDSSDRLVEGTSNLFFLGSRVLASVLTGLNTATSAVVSSTDSVLSAFGKLQAQLTALTSTVANKINVGGSAEDLVEGASHLFMTPAERTKLDNLNILDYALSTWAYGQVFRLVSATRDANEAIVTATIVWPDGVAGTFTTDVASSAFPGAIDAWHATYDSTPFKTVTQPAVTRDANGAVTAQPAITIA